MMMNHGDDYDRWWWCIWMMVDDDYGWWCMMMIDVDDDGWC